MSELASYATIQTRGRKVFEAIPKYRTEFERDRDRVIHSSAFRRLEYKTQVFINHEGDLFRTRLTHSLEVAQIGRSIAKALRLNVDLVEAICLVHDLGHTPFGHAGQDELNRCLIEIGEPGFEHNLQSLRIVDVLEERYPEFNGLNLTFETREGILKHCSLVNAKKLGDIGVRFLEEKQPSLEAQLANIADELAYNYHDVDDGLRANLLTLEQLESIDLIKNELQQILKKYPTLKGRRLEKELVRVLISRNIYDLIESTLANIKQHQVISADDVRNAPVLVKYGEQIYQSMRELKKFLNKNMYQHSTVMQLRFKANNIIRSLFKVYIDNPRLLPESYQARLDSMGKASVVVDYISGMTDRYAFRQYNRLFLVESV